MGMDSTKYGGIERFNVALARSLLEKGFISIFIYESLPMNHSYIEDLTDSKAIITVSNARNRPLHFCKDVYMLIRQYRPILVHAHFTKARFYAIPLASWMGVKKLYFTIHSMMDPIENIKPITKLWYWKANKIAKVIAVSDDIENTYRKNWPTANIERIYLGVPYPSEERLISRKKLGLSEDQMMLLCIANFNHIKGLDILIKAAAILKEGGLGNDKTLLYIVGQPQQDIDALKEDIDRLGLTQVVNLIGISNIVPTYIAASDIYIQPSRSEGTPLSLMESASYSLPLIGSRIGGIPEVISDGDNGIIVEPGNEMQLASAIKTLILDSEMRTEFGQKSYQFFKEKFTIDNGVKQTLNYYNL